MFYYWKYHNQSVNYCFHLLSRHSISHCPCWFLAFWPLDTALSVTPSPPFFSFVSGPRGIVVVQTRPHLFYILASSFRSWSLMTLINVPIIFCKFLYFYARFSEIIPRFVGLLDVGLSHPRRTATSFRFHLVLPSYVYCGDSFKWVWRNLKLGHSSFFA